MFYEYAKMCKKEQDAALKAGGEKALKECIHGQVGSYIGMASGSMAGAAIGSVVPVVGTAVGFFVGGVVGMISGSADKTPRDNARSGILWFCGIKKMLK